MAEHEKKKRKIPPILTAGFKKLREKLAQPRKLRELAKALVSSPAALATLTAATIAAAGVSVVTSYEARQEAGDALAAVREATTVTQAELAAQAAQLARMAEGLHIAMVQGDKEVTAEIARQVAKQSGKIADAAGTAEELDRLRNLLGDDSDTVSSAELKRLSEAARDAAKVAEKIRRSIDDVSSEQEALKRALNDLRERLSALTGQMDINRPIRVFLPPMSVSPSDSADSEQAVFTIRGDKANYLYTIQFAPNNDNTCDSVHLYIDDQFVRRVPVGNTTAGQAISYSDRRLLKSGEHTAHIRVDAKGGGLKAANNSNCVIGTPLLTLNRLTN